MTSIELPELSSVAGASDAELERLLATFAEARRRVDAGAAIVAGEVARRSSREHGYGGLAQRTGDRTPEAFVARVTGSSGREARDLVAVGRLTEATPPWFADVASGVASGDVSVGVAAAITTGLGDPSGDVSPDDLLDAAQTLVADAGHEQPEKVARRAREMRDALDAAGVADREADLRARRWLRLSRLASGMTRVAGELDPESAAIVAGAIDAVTSPRRGGPRFVDAEELDRAQAVERDSRSTEQIAADALVDMVRIAVAADDGRVFGARRPAVRVHVAAQDLATGSGAAHLEGQSAAVSVATAERLACADGYLPIVVQPDGRLDVGRAQRLFTERQRSALAATWGGCAVESCDRPPAWTEAHHVVPWSHGGRTDVANGILLCRHHHLLVHNNGWRIDLPPGDADGGWMTPPRDPVARRLRLLRKNPVRQRLRGDTRGLSRRRPRHPEGAEPTRQ